MLIDTHCHLNFEELENRLPQVLRDAKANDVLSMIIIGIDPKSTEKAIKLANKHNLYASVGIHPSNVDHFEIEDIIKYVYNERVVAIGETGIDLYWRQDNLERQKEMFIKHIELAIRFDLPLVIHMRDSFDEIYDILKQYKGQVRGVMHCFTLGIEEAKKLIDLGFYLGIGGVITYKNAKELRAAVKSVPLTKILLETDAPYLAPAPFRGKRNEPAYMKWVAIELADLLGLSYQEVSDVTTNNAKELFKLGE